MVMELSPFVVATLTISFTLSLLYYFYLVSSRSTGKKPPPEAGGGLPIIGHLHLLARSSTPAMKTLSDMADKYGPIFLLRLGVNKTLIVSNSVIAKECFTKNDKAFASRPHSMSSDIMCYKSAMFAVSPYGPYWREIRKITTLELLSNHRIEMMKHVRESEIRTSLKEVYELCGKSNMVVKMELKQWFKNMNMNMICRLVAGKRCVGTTKTKAESEEYERCRKGLIDSIELAGRFTFGDSIPYLKWLDFNTEKAMRKTFQELDSILQGWLDEHKLKKTQQQAEGDKDFMDVMLSICQEQDDAVKSSTHDADTIIKATCMALVLGGAETITISLIWAVSLLINNPQVLKKAQDEIDACVGKERKVEESDLPKLVYLLAIFKETLRLYPPALLDAPHLATEDCIVSGYHVSAGTQLLVNISKLQRDPNVWPNPDEFQPERFMKASGNVDFRGNHFELLPFSAGRRVCPGISFANQVFLVILANLLHGFEIRSTTGGPIDMTEGVGITNERVTPLDVLLSPRLSGDLYD